MIKSYSDIENLANSIIKDEHRDSVILELNKYNKDYLVNLFKVASSVSLGLEDSILYHIAYNQLSLLKAIDITYTSYKIVCNEKINSFEMAINSLGENK